MLSRPPLAVGGAPRCFPPSPAPSPPARARAPPTPPAPLTPPHAAPIVNAYTESSPDGGEDDDNFPYPDDPSTPSTTPGAVVGRSFGTDTFDNSVSPFDSVDSDDEDPTTSTPWIEEDPAWIENAWEENKEKIELDAASEVHVPDISGYLGAPLQLHEDYLGYEGEDFGGAEEPIAQPDLDGGSLYEEEVDPPAAPTPTTDPMPRGATATAAAAPAPPRAPAPLAPPATATTAYTPPGYTPPSYDPAGVMRTNRIAGSQSDLNNFTGVNARVAARAALATARVQAAAAAKAAGAPGTTTIAPTPTTTSLSSSSTSFFYCCCYY